MSTSSCTHFDQLACLRAPKISQQVHREECTQCFDSQDDPQGVDICLTCFNGGCTSNGRDHALLHFQKNGIGHGWSLNVRRKVKEQAARTDSEPPLKLQKLAIIPTAESDRYTYETRLRCWGCGGGDQVGRIVDEDEWGRVPGAKKLIESVMSSASSSKQSEIKAWEEELTACEHTLLLNQEPSTATSKGTVSTQCSHPGCELKENLWLCLACGNVGCGRKQWGGVGGEGHALMHFDDMRAKGGGVGGEGEGHGVCVKLGTVTAEGEGDVYCYICNDARIDPSLPAHLKTLGLPITPQTTKTAKSTTEMQIEQNLSLSLFDFAMVDPSTGLALEPVFGPGKTGLANLGNSCYVNSVMQVLFSLPGWKRRYFFGQGSGQGEKNGEGVTSLHAVVCPKLLPAECLDCQMCKVADGLLSGRYSVPRKVPAADDILPLDSNSPPSSNEKEKDQGPAFQSGLRPMTFKTLIGRNHAEFSGMKQQDAEEFFGWLLDVLRRETKKVGGGATSGAMDVDSSSDKEKDSRREEPTQLFRYATEQRLQCTVCQKVRYRTDESDVCSVPVEVNEEISTSTEQSGDGDGKKEGAEEKKYSPVSMESCISSLMGEEELDYGCPSCGKAVKAVKQTRFASFPEILAVQTRKFQLVNWVPTKIDVPVIVPANDTLTLSSLLGKGPQPSEELLPEDSSTATPSAPQLPQFNEAAMAQLEGMGFPAVRCQKALLATGNSDAESAMEWLFAHMEDPDIDDPIQLPGAGGHAAAKAEPSQEQVSMLSEMGFTPAQARKALRETDSNPERAIEWLFSHPDDTGEDVPSVPASQPASSSTPSGAVAAISRSLPGSSSLPATYKLKAFISHKGASVHSGHYIAHIRMEKGEKGEGEDGWILFNDEKVVKADQESVDDLKRYGYLYFFERVRGRV